MCTVTRVTLGRTRAAVTAVGASGHVPLDAAPGDVEEYMEWYTKAGECNLLLVLKQQNSKVYSYSCVLLLAHAFRAHFKCNGPSHNTTHTRPRLHRRQDQAHRALLVPGRAPPWPHHGLQCHGRQAGGEWLPTAAACIHCLFVAAAAAAVGLHGLNTG